MKWGSHFIFLPGEEAVFRGIQDAPAIDILL